MKDIFKGVTGGNPQPTLSFLHHIVIEMNDFNPEAKVTSKVRQRQLCDEFGRRSSLSSETSDFDSEFTEVSDGNPEGITTEEFGGCFGKVGHKTYGVVAEFADGFEVEAFAIYECEEPLSFIGITQNGKHVCQAYCNGSDGEWEIMSNLIHKAEDRFTEPSRVEGLLLV